ncbi:GumC family protein [Defluviitalea phaphyphila]|uniref:GumC family protein n=1 Tax=Defluviitalea phaphyphila TaxID=1473580 RepID=UPI0007306A87|nr:Wzz/FepE/Etk N-terminal domain-containing protein [Defluviitalea phaphyphila]
MEEEISLRELIEVILKGKKLIGIITAVTVIISIVISFAMPKVYEANTTLLANPIGSQQSKEIIDSSDVLDTISQYPEMTLETYKEQFSNAEVLQAVIDELDLKDKNDEKIKVSDLKNKINVEVIDDTNLIKVTVKDKDPELAAKIANTLGDKFIDFITDMTKKKSQQAVEAITEQLEIEKQALDEEAQKKRDYLINSEDIETLNQEIEIIRQQLTDYKQNLIDVEKQIQSDIKALETLAENGIKSTNIDLEAIKGKIELSEVKDITTDEENTDNNTINNTGNDINIGQSLEFNISNSSALESAMLTAQRTQMETRLVQNISEKEVLEQKIEELQERLSNLRATLATEEYKYNEVMRNYQLAEQSFQAYLTKKNEAEQNAAADIGRASIIVSSPATAPDIPASPNKKLNVAIGLVLGLMIGVFVVFFKEYWENTSNPSK